MLKMVDKISIAAAVSLLSAVRDQGPISRVEIARRLHMSPATVGRMVETLLQIEIIKEQGQRHQNGHGRPSILLEFNPSYRSVLTVDLRLTEAYAVISDLAGNILSRETCTLAINDTEESLSELITLIQKMLHAHTGLPPVEAIMIGAPSIVDVETGTIEWAFSLGWRDLPIRRILEEAIPIPVYVENDVNLAMLGEYWKGAGKSYKNNLVFVSVGTGIGAGIILNGELYRGSTHAAGEVAYFVTDVDVLRNNRDQVAQLEGQVGSEGLIKMAHLVALRSPSSPLAELLRKKASDVKPQDILDLALRGDPGAKVIYNELVDVLTIVINNIAVVLDPEVIILGSPSMDVSTLIPSIHDRLGDTLLRPVNLVSSECGGDALIMGGAFSALPMLRGLLT